MSWPTILDGIRLCDDATHTHASTCRVACEICDVLYPPRTLVDGICRQCWQGPRTGQRGVGNHPSGLEV